MGATITNRCARAYMYMYKTTDGKNHTSLYEPTNVTVESVKCDAENSTILLTQLAHLSDMFHSGFDCTAIKHSTYFEIALRRRTHPPESKSQKVEF